MPFSEMTVMIAVVAAVVLGFIHLLRLLGTLIMHRTLRKVVESDPQRAEALLAKSACAFIRVGGRVVDCAVRI